MRLLLTAALFAPTLLAQNFTGQIKIKPFLPPLSQPWKIGTPQQPALSLKESVVEVSGPCSIPLLTAIPVDIDSKMTITPPSTGFAMRVVTPPAPACNEKLRP